MRETQRQIEKYKAQLPHMRERVAAALVLLIMAAVMMVSSSFAWIVLSSNPEVKGMNTTITSNGNLEIALANGTTITQPADSEVGDGGKDLALKNITWGNLINLGDPIYGLENIVLRPATLNTNSLLESPLYAAGYGTDGRVDTLESDFAFAGWDATNQTFLAQNVNYGVRTIASVTYKDAGGDAALAARVSSAETKIASAKTNLQSIANADQIDDLGALMQQYVQEMVNQKLGSSASVIKIDPEHMESIYEMMGMLQGNMEMIADALAESYNIQLIRRMGNAHYEANKFTGEELLTADMATINAKMGVKNQAGETAVVPADKTWLTTLRTKYAGLKADIVKIEALRGRTDVVWENLDGTAEENKKPELYPIVNNVVHISSAKIDGTALSSLSKDAIMDLVGKSKVTVEVQSGYLKDADQLSGACVKSKEITLTVRAMGIPKSVKGTVITYASNAKNTEKYAITEEYNTALSGATNFKGTDPVAEDTFGMALDFFVRTNATNSHLILQGSPVYEEQEEIATGIVDGESVTLYTVTADEIEYTAYKEGNTYYRYDENTNMAGEQLENVQNPTLKKVTVKYVVGYNGVNRVWDENSNAQIDTDSTTQGSGSCYVFYPGSPEDQEKSLQLLEHFRIAFVDQEGNLLTTAYMDVEHCFAQTGKVTVPLVLSNTGSYITGSDGEPIYTITELAQNEATFISALVYLDGVGLTNDQVLAAGEIQGQLNLQFGSSSDLNAMKDPVLMDEKCQVTATMAGATEVDFNVATTADLTKTITVEVNGTTPNKVEAYFLRIINSTQGVRQEKMVFTKGADGKWTATHKFTSPGSYILREVMLDGTTYELDHEPITFTVKGFAISSVTCVDNNKTFMTTDKRFETTVSITFAGDANAKMPTSVKGAFIHKETGNRTTVYFSPDQQNSWSGTAVFETSGEYRLEHVELNNEPTGLTDEQKQYINLYLGLRARVYAAGTTTFEEFKQGDSYEIPMSLAIESDDGTKMENLSNIWLYYANSASSVEEMGMSSKMEWNGNSGYYEGTFSLTKAGIYNFSRVTISSGNLNSSLTTATASPTITAIPPDPPSFAEMEAKEKQFSFGAGANFTATLKDAPSATVDAVLYNSETPDTPYYVRGTMAQSALGAEYQSFVFELPGDQVGTWTLSNLYVTGVYDDNNNLVNGSSAEAPPATAEEAETYYENWWEWTSAKIGAPYTTTVVDNVEWSIDEGQELTDLTGQFYGTYDLSTLGTFNVKVLPGGFAPSEVGISDEEISVKVIYQYDTGSVTNDGTTITNDYGHFTLADVGAWNNIVGSIGNVEFNSAVVGSGAYTLSTKAKLLEGVAGKYIPKSLQITIKRGAVSKTYTSDVVTNAPTFEIYYNKPDLKWTKVTPGSYTKKEGTSEITESGYMLDAYFSYNVRNTFLGQIPDGYDAATATLSFSNAVANGTFGSNFDSATITLYYYYGYRNVTFNFTNSTLSVAKDFGDGGKAPGRVGEGSFDTVPITKDDLVYTFTLKQEVEYNGH